MRDTMTQLVTHVRLLTGDNNNDCSCRHLTDDDIQEQLDLHSRQQSEILEHRGLGLWCSSYQYWEPQSVTAPFPVFTTVPANTLPARSQNAKGCWSFPEQTQEVCATGSVYDVYATAVVCLRIIIANTAEVQGFDVRTSAGGQYARSQINQQRHQMINQYLMKCWTEQAQFVRSDLL